MKKKNERPINQTIKELARMKGKPATYFVGKISDIKSHSGISHLWNTSTVLSPERLEQFEAALDLEKGELEKIHNEMSFSIPTGSNELLDAINSGFDRIHLSDQEQIRFLQKQIEQKDNQLNQAQQLIGTFMPYIGTLLGKLPSELEPANGKSKVIPQQIGFGFPVSGIA